MSLSVPPSLVLIPSIIFSFVLQGGEELHVQRFPFVCISAASDQHPSRTEGKLHEAALVLSLSAVLPSCFKSIVYDMYKGKL